MPQKHLVQVNLREKLNFHDFYFQLRGADYEDLTMIKSEIFYCIKISKKLSKIICFMQNHELLVFYCGHQSKVHRQKWVSTNRQLIVANLIYITLKNIKITLKNGFGYLKHVSKVRSKPRFCPFFMYFTIRLRYKNTSNSFSSKL